jgi:hypothetical protein
MMIMVAIAALVAAQALPPRVETPAPAEPKASDWGNGMVSNSRSPAPVTVRIPMPPPEPIMAIPQDGPGEADLSVWDPRSPKEIRNLGRFKSIPKCRAAKAKLKLAAGAKAYCTVAPENRPRLHI